MIPLTLHRPEGIYQINGHQLSVRFDALRVPDSDGVLSVARRGALGHLTVQWVGMFSEGHSDIWASIQFAFENGWLSDDKVRMHIGANAYKSPTEFKLKPDDGSIGWFFDEIYGDEPIVADLTYHAEFFRRLGIVPLLNPIAQRLLNEREAALGIEFPLALREFLVLRDAPRLFSGTAAITPSLSKFAEDTSERLPFAKLYSNEQGVTFYIRLVNPCKGDPEVYIVEDYDDDLDENGRPIRVFMKFTDFLLDQLQYIESWSTSPVGWWAGTEQRKKSEKHSWRKSLLEQVLSIFK